MPLNPNKTRNNLKQADLQNEHGFPYFINQLNVEQFRSIKNLELNFVHPLTIITGTNKIGKTSIMAMLACSHVEFQMRDLGTGEFKRCTWSRLIKFTQHDKQLDDWKYKIKHKIGNQIEELNGWRLKDKKKWSGLAKKTGQIEHRRVVYIDVDRITPAYACSNMLFLNTQKARSITLIEEKIKEYFEYIFESPFVLAKIAHYQNRTSYKLNNNFTSFNSASGEDVLLSILIDAVEADKKSLILIDELELGLHPKIQRRLVDVLMDISEKDKKQFVVTTHSPTLLSSFDSESRIYIENTQTGYRGIPKISVNAAFSKMDSEIFPLINLFCEDNISKKIIEKALQYIQSDGHYDIHKMVNIIESGSSSVAKENYYCSKRIFDKLKIKIGYALVLDGDQVIAIQMDDFIMKLFSNEAPEKFLLKSYLLKHPNANLTHHLNNSDTHCLFDKCIEQSVAVSKDEVFEKMYSDIEQTKEYQNWLLEFKQFLIKTCKYFSEKN